MKEESMKNKVEKDPGRRKFLKTGLALAGGSLLASSVGARNFTEQRKEKNQNTQQILSPEVVNWQVNWNITIGNAISQCPRQLMQVTIKYSLQEDMNTEWL
jgi:hypothetical protein